MINVIAIDFGKIKIGLNIFSLFFLEKRIILKSLITTKSMWGGITKNNLNLCFVIGLPLNCFFNKKIIININNFVLYIKYFYKIPIFFVNEDYSSIIFNFLNSLIYSVDYLSSRFIINIFFNFFFNYIIYTAPYINLNFLN